MTDGNVNDVRFLTTTARGLDDDGIWRALVQISIIGGEDDGMHVGTFLAGQMLIEGAQFMVASATSRCLNAVGDLLKDDIDIPEEIVTKLLTDVVGRLNIKVGK